MTVGYNPFRIHVRDDVLDDLRRRLTQTRWPTRYPERAGTAESERYPTSRRIANDHKDIERFQLGVSAIHGGAGPVDVEIGRPAEAVSEAFMASCVTAGMSRVDDVNGSDL